MALVRLVSDVAIDDPSGDTLRYKRYVVPIVGIVTNPAAETPFTIGVFGTWGSGKSTVLRLVENALQHRSPDKFVLVQFNAWLHRKEPNILVALLHALHAELNKMPGERFAASTRKITEVLIRLGADVLLKKLTLDAVSLEKLETLEKKYQEAKGQVESEMRRLHDILKTELLAIGEDGTRVVFFVDDLDRCEPEQIVDVLECLKLFFDLRNAFIIVAADKEIIDRGIEVRYGKFMFGSRMAGIGAEYIEKMVQLPLQLFPIFADQVETYIRDLAPPADFTPHIKLLASVVTPNPRRIKRVINTLTVFGEMANVDGSLASLKRDVLMRLAVMQLQSPDVYASAAADPDLLLALEETYTNPEILHANEKWAKYGEKRTAYMQFCQASYVAGSYLSRLFVGTPFKATGADLRLHLAMFGS
jgi:hypothetical protein